jgi:hypothetical protein
LAASTLISPRPFWLDQFLGAGRDRVAERAGVSTNAIAAAPVKGHAACRRPGLAGRRHAGRQRAALVLGIGTLAFGTSALGIAALIVVAAPAAGRYLPFALRGLLR